MGQSIAHSLGRAVRGSTGLALLWAAIVLPATAEATPPTLQSATQSGGRITASWTLPAGMAMDYIEAGTSPAVTAAGDFPIANTALAESLDDFATSYVASVQIPSATYFVHVSAFSPAKCITGDEPECVDEWSNILTVTTPPGPVPDKVTAFASIQAPSPQRIGKLFVTASMPEPGRIAAAATVKVPGASKVYRFKSVSKRVAAGVAARFPLKLSKKRLRVVKKALKRRKKLAVKVTLTAKDDAGNVQTARRTIKLKR
jgi:hypothetical protein